MGIKNNRYRRSYTKYSDHIKKEWRIYALITGACFLIALFFVSWFMQFVAVKSGELVRYHVINPLFIIYYGAIRGFLITLIAGLIGASGICYYRFYITMVDYEYDPRGFAISPRGTYGTNRIMSNEERDAFFEKTSIADTDKNVVYKDENDGSVYVVRNTKGLGPHKFVCGASGSWKTSSVFIPDIMQMIRRGESGICTDPKGELRSKCYKMAKKHNYIVRELNLINPMLSDGCDFMNLVETYGDARTFTEIIMMNTSGDSSHNEDFWAKGERAAICFGILYVKESAEYEGRRTFKNVFEFLKNDLATLNSAADYLPEGSNAKSQWGIFQTTPDNSKGGVMTGVTTRLQILNDPAIAEITGKDEIDLTLPGTRPCLYFVIVSDQESSNNVITSIFFSFLFVKLVKMADQRHDQTLPVAVNFLLDEMPNVCKIPEFPKKLSTIRSRNMKCTICAQDIGQMQNLFPGTQWANVISNCDTQVMLGCNDPEITGPFWSNAYGTMTIIVETEKEGGDRFAPININRDIGISSGDGKRDVYTVGEICGLKNEYALIRFRGHNVKNGLKFSYFEHPMYEEIEEENYFRHEPLWWSSVADEAANCDNIKEYDWFKQGVNAIADLNEKLERERLEDKLKEKEVEKKTQAIRQANVAEGDKEEKKDIKVRWILLKRQAGRIIENLKGKPSQALCLNDSVKDGNLEKAFNSFKGKTGEEEKIYDDAYLAGEGEKDGNLTAPVVDDRNTYDTKRRSDSRRTQSEGSLEGTKLSKAIRKNFTPAEEKTEEKKDKKRSLMDSFGSIIKKATLKKEDIASDLSTDEKSGIRWADENNEDEDLSVNVPWANEDPAAEEEDDEDVWQMPDEGYDTTPPYDDYNDWIPPEDDIPEISTTYDPYPETENEEVEPDKLNEPVISIAEKMRLAQKKHDERQKKIDSRTTKKTRGL